MLSEENRVLLRQAAAVANRAAFEVDFAPSVSSLGALQITLAEARDQFKLGLSLVEDVIHRLPTHQGEQE